MNVFDCQKELNSEKTLTLFCELYRKNQVNFQKERYCKALNRFSALFGDSKTVAVFSAPGRTELGGNHTDHQHGCVLGGTIDLDLIGISAPRDDNFINVHSDGYPPIQIELNNLSPTPADSQTAALARGVLAGFESREIPLKGFDLTIDSNVPVGGGVSSSAAFELLLCTVVNHYTKSNLPPITLAQIGKEAEERYLGKACGLLDQAVCALGGVVFLDFANETSPRIEKIDFDIEDEGYALFLVNTGGSHANLTAEYLSIRSDMRNISAFFEKQVLSQVPETIFYENIPQLAKAFGERAVLRSMHFFEETLRAKEELTALKSHDTETFLQLVRDSGFSSQALLQNLYSEFSPAVQPIPLALALSERLLNGRGAVRVHGGGFAGTIQTYVPMELQADYRNRLEAVFGKNACHRVRIRPYGAIKLFD